MMLSVQDFQVHCHLLLHTQLRLLWQLNQYHPQCSIVQVLVISVCWCPSCRLVGKLNCVHDKAIVWMLRSVCGRWNHLIDTRCKCLHDFWIWQWKAHHNEASFSCWEHIWFLCCTLIQGRFVWNQSCESFGSVSFKCDRSLDSCFVDSRM